MWAEGTPAAVNPRLLIDAIVRQTTVLIAQISTATGIRAPLAHVAEQVFVSLARELESQGVRRKVVADMFGLALRTYQKKVQRLAESATQKEQTLWQGVLAFIESDAAVSRRRVLERFRNDDEAGVGAVLQDLVGSGLVYVSGYGPSAIYRATTDAERRGMEHGEETESLAAFVWAAVFREPGVTVGSLLNAFPVDAGAVRAAVEQLLADGRLDRAGEGDAATLRAAALVVPVGSERGWEAAVYDHYQAVASAIAEKVRIGPRQSAETDVVGGTTLRFGIHEGHPHAARVLGMLTRVRKELADLWEEVTAHNRANPVPEDQRTQVTFYFGQSIRNAAGSDATPIDPEEESS